MTRTSVIPTIIYRLVKMICYLKKNVTEGAELGYDVGATKCNEDGHAVTMHDKDHEFDDLECPSSEELLSGVSSDDEVGYRFSEFTVDMDMRYPRFEGKLAPDRGYGAGLSQPHKEFQSFQFLSTPSIGNQQQTIFQDEGPAASIPFSEIGPSSHTQEIIEQMNFEELDEQNNAFSRSRVARANARRLAGTATH
ncbi:Hypothetical predicted protein [Olea europaea subsp. europaea]|uniref:Uncharacterized protein n=1 Tax=Olea europaea subsp. europaea TaxID=158383 RepID=A0A8S0UAI6_OLEEU|nr:Hypothetical predicted protein [Olea europaea subsp. europaea]